MGKSILPFGGVLAGMGFLIISNVCMADEPSVPGFPQGGMDPYAAEPVPPQNPSMGMPMPMDPSQGVPNTAPGVSQPPQMPPASDEEFPAAANTDKRKVQRFMGRIRAMEMRMAALERRLAMLERGGGGTGGFPGGMPGGRPGGMQGGHPGMMSPGQPGMMPPGQPGHFGGKIRPRGLSDEEKTDTGSSSEQPASTEPGSPSK